MLLTLSTTHHPATDLGFLLHKNPRRAQSFTVSTGTAHVLYPEARTGRPFFRAAIGASRAQVVLARVRSAISAAGLWDELATGWLLIDTELLPWSAKAEELLRTQYAATGAAARAVLPPVVAALRSAAARGQEVGELLSRQESRLANAAGFTAAYRRYCWPTEGVAGLRMAPFAVLAGEAGVWAGNAHSWHLGLVDRLVAARCDHRGGAGAAAAGNPPPGGGSHGRGVPRRGGALVGGAHRRGR